MIRGWVEPTHISYPNVEKLACKNSISWQGAVYPGMFRVFAVYTTLQLQIVGWALSGKRHKILVEVRLIIETAFVRDPRPIDGLNRVNRAKNVPKPVETR